MNFKFLIVNPLPPDDTVHVMADLSDTLGDGLIVMLR